MSRYYNYERKLSIIGDSTCKYYGKDYNDENYKSLYNKIFSTIKVLYRKDNVREIYTSAESESGLLACMACIDCKNQMNLNDLKIYFYIPIKNLNLILNSDYEKRVWKYIKENLPKENIILKENRDNNKTNNHNPVIIYRTMIRKSDIVLGIFPYENTNVYINNKTGFNGKQTFCTIGMNFAVELKKDIRVIDIEEITYKNLMISTIIEY